MIVRCIASAAGVALAVVPLASAARADQLAMPYQCKLERGHLLLVPGGERQYEILGAKSQQAFMHCATPGSDRCRVRMVHRFDILCAGARVPWMVVAAAAARHHGRDAFIERGRLHMVAAQGPAPADCFDVPWARLGTRPNAANGTLERPCWPRLGDQRAVAHVVTYPPGFAPLGESGARIVLGTQRPQAAQAASQHHLTSPAERSPAGETAGSTPPIVPAVKAAVVAVEPGSAQLSSVAPSTGHAGDLSTGPSGAIQLADASGASALRSHWVVTVQQDRAERSGHEVDGRWMPPMTSWLIVVVLLSLAAAAVMARTVPAARRAVASVGQRGMAALTPLLRSQDVSAGTDVAEDRAVADLRRTAERLRGNADTLLASLEQAAPLRGALRQELDLIAQRLAAIPPAGGTDQSRRMVRQRVQTGIRELHRVIKIAEAAAASFAEGGVGSKVPTSREEAYALLGVNDGASEATLKKLVDALRMSWHPDHARGETDRLLREERTKQINIAWDLITVRRI